MKVRGLITNTTKRSPARRHRAASLRASASSESQPATTDSPSVDNSSDNMVRTLTTPPQSLRSSAKGAAGTPFHTPMDGSNSAAKNSGGGGDEFVTIRKDELVALIKNEVNRARSELDDRIASVASGGGAGGAGGATPNSKAYPSAVYYNNDDEDTPKGVLTKKGGYDQTPLILPTEAEIREQFAQEGGMSPSPSGDEDDIFGGDLAKGESEEVDEEWHCPFGESTYTLMYLRPFCSQSWIFSIFIYAIQMSTIFLTLLDVIYRSIPPMVNMTVTCAQGVTIFMLVAYMSDLIEAVLKLQDGHYPEVAKEHPAASFWTWLFSCTAQLTAGLLVLVTSFILTMQSTTVLDLMLNLTALLFMSEIDDIGFAMAKMGFVTDMVQKQCLKSLDLSVPKPKRRNMYRRLLYFFAVLGLYAGFGFIKYRQLRGAFLPSYIYVQFGDAYEQKIAYYSGILTSSQEISFSHRQYRDLGTDNVLLGYCQEELIWTFSFDDDPCNYTAKSTKTDTFIPSLIPDSNWFVKDSVGRFQPFDSFSMVIRDCDPEFCKGECVDKVCQCPHDRFGMDCEFSNVCPELLTDSRFELFPAASVEHNGGISNFAVSDEFQLLKNNVTGEYVRVYNMPVYYSDKTFPAKVIFFAGRRWVMTSEYDLIDFNKIWFSTYEEKGSYTHFFPKWTVDRLEDPDFHAYEKTNYTPFFFSDPVDFETPLFQATPLGLQWWTIRKTLNEYRKYEPDFLLETKLICKSCLAEHDGFCNSAGGICNATTGLCECKNSYFGDKCEQQEACYEQPQPCDGNGVCDKNSGFCKCHNPWYGKLCYYTHPCVDEYGKCMNGGTCNDATSLCDCPNDPSIDGDACERSLDCQVTGCANGGYCGLDGKCLCKPPYKGVRCDRVDESQEEFFCSENSDCVNGSCNTTSGICTCFDRARYGTKCEHRYGCDWGGCLNGGVCNNATQICECPPPYFGPDCSQEPLCVEDSYCQTYYGRTSICDYKTGSCRCAARGAKSKFCFSSRFNCKHAGCSGRGTCTELGRCECPYPYAGRQCEYLLEEYQAFERATYRAGLELCIEELGFPPYDQQLSLAARQQFMWNIDGCVRAKTPPSNSVP